MKIRPARPTDTSALAGLLTELGYPSSPEQVVQRLAYWSGDPASVILLAEHDGWVRGSLSLHAIPYLERDGRFARIESLVFDAETRGTGVGRALIDAAEKQEREWGCVAMEVTSSRRRVEAHAFYRRMGYVDLTLRSGRFWKTLD